MPYPPQRRRPRASPGAQNHAAAPPFDSSPLSSVSNENESSIWDDRPLSSSEPREVVQAPPKPQIRQQSMLTWVEELVLGTPDYQGFTTVRRLAMSAKMAICMVVGWSVILAFLMCLAQQYWAVIYFILPFICAYLCLRALVKKSQGGLIFFSTFSFILALAQFVGLIFIVLSIAFVDKIDQCKYGRQLTSSDNKFGDGQIAPKHCGSAEHQACSYCYCRFANITLQENLGIGDQQEFDGTYTWMYIYGGTRSPYDFRASFATVSWCDVNLWRLRILFFLICGVTCVSIVFYLYASCKGRELAMQTEYFQSSPKKDKCMTSLSSGKQLVATPFMSKVAMPTPISDSMGVESMGVESPPAGMNMFTVVSL